MASRRLVWLGGGALALGLGVLALSQTQFGQRLYYAAQIERTLDRYAQSDTTQTSVTARIDAEGREAALLSAFFGLDQGLPRLVGDWAVCEGAGGADGMPVIFSHEVDVTTLDPGDFKVTLRSGKVGKTVCLTLAPADDPGELRTALLTGEFGSLEDPPVSVEVTGDVLSLDGKVTFKGAQVDVTPLEAGPTMVLAQTVPEGEWALDQPATPIPFGGGSGCPAGTRQIVRVTWDGGITKPGGQPADDAEGALYKVSIETGDGATETIAPMALADTGDGDNNHKLCLNRAEPARAVSFPAGHLTDPREDLNPATSVPVSR